MSDEGTIERYGMTFPDSLSLLDIELWCYRWDPRPEGTGGRLSRWEHFKNIVDMIWNRPESSFKVVWNSWTEKNCYECIYNRYLGIAGCGSSTKSFAMALYGMVEYFSAPTKTLVLFTSTTKDAAKMRCWKSVAQLWSVAGKLGLPGKHVRSKTIIYGVDDEEDLVDYLGMRVVAAGKGKEKDAVDDIQGTKAEKLILMADELEKLEYSIIKTAISNLDGNPEFELKAAGNPEMRLKSLGKFCKPRDGWKSVDENDYEWYSDLGKVVRWDARKNPRLVNPDGSPRVWNGPGPDPLRFFPGRETIEKNIHKFGENSRIFWTQFVGMWPKDGLVDMIFSESELEPWMGEVDPNEWDEPPHKRGLSLDCAYSSKGDASPLMWGHFGTIKGVKTLEVLNYRNAKDDVTKESELSAELLDEFKLESKRQHVPAKQCGFDSTGWGTVFDHFVKAYWSTSIRDIHFEGNPVARNISIQRDTTQEFDRRVSQLWGQMKPLFRYGQIRGLTSEIVEQLVGRMWDPKKTGKKLAVESKIDMKARTGVSPDLADALAILVEVGIINQFLDFRETKATRQRVMKEFKERSRRQNARNRRRRISTLGTKRLKH